MIPPTTREIPKKASTTRQGRPDGGEITSHTSSATPETILRSRPNKSGGASMRLPLEIVRKGLQVFVAAAGDVEDYGGVAGHLGRAADQFGHGVRSLERTQDALGAGQSARGINRGGVAHGSVLRAAAVGEPGVFRAYGWIVQPGGNRMRRSDLPCIGLQHPGVSALENAGASPGVSSGGGEAC